MALVLLDKWRSQSSEKFTVLKRKNGCDFSQPFLYSLFATNQPLAYQGLVKTLNVRRHSFNFFVAHLLSDIAHYFVCIVITLVFLECH